MKYPTQRDATATPLATEVLLRVVEERLHTLIAERTARAETYSPRFKQLWEGIHRSINGGKRVRPRLFLDSYVEFGGTDAEAAVNTACALELLHTAFVIHDDVIDNDFRRRGVPNISGRFRTDVLKRDVSLERANNWGTASSILAGDLLLTLAQSLLARLDVDTATRISILDVFDRTVVASAAGEHEDVWLSLGIEEPSSLELLAMIEQKTAVYSFQAPLSLAAILAGASDEAVDQLDAIARHIGIVYQLRDDVLGVFGDEQHTGKSRDSDLREGKATLLISFARLDPAWMLVEPLFGRSDMSRADADRLRHEIKRSGALLLMEAAISEQLEAVRPLIYGASVPVTLKHKLMSLLQTSRERIS